MRKQNRDNRFEEIGFDGQVEDESTNTWAVSYADVVTILLTFLFFILSISEINAKKFEEMKKEVKNEESVIEVKNIYEELIKIVEKEGISKHVDIKQTKSGVEVNIRDKLLFGSGSSDIKSQNYSSLSSIVNAFKKLPKEYRINIEGHTDDVPINNEQYPSNWHLSANRALSVLNLFIDEGFSEQRFAVQGMSDTKPLVPVFDNKGRVIKGNRAKNRRVLIKVN